MGRNCQFHQLLALQPQGVEHNQQTLKGDLYPHCNIQMRHNLLTSVLAYNPFHHVPHEPVDEIFLSSLIQPKDNTAIQYLYLCAFHQTLGYSHLQLRFQCVFRSYDSHFAYIVKHGDGHRQGLRKGAMRGISYPGPRGTGAREDESTHAKFFVVKTKIFCSQVPLAP